MADIPRCPTPCDDDCEQACHEVHQIPRRRDHNPETCVAAIVSAAVAAAVAAERERLWNRPVTQRLELRGGYPGGVWQCAGCEAQLTESGITHAPRCSEMRLADLLEPTP